MGLVLTNAAHSAWYGCRFGPVRTYHRVLDWNVRYTPRTGTATPGCPVPCLIKDITLVGCCRRRKSRAYRFEPGMTRAATRIRVWCRVRQTEFNQTEILLFPNGLEPQCIIPGVKMDVFSGRAVGLDLRIRVGLPRALSTLSCSDTRRADGPS